ncbi:uncharacterized protein LOC113214002 [Frankliniella occidentalis]|uniref:Uncharacterized protein LOC113214002 n=1 Tax=Frankliniella occidentalis TaxID=133901 RepID=A0A6J1T806_FRAOC|nr:uncharacterized protein LOC113214002 [Frankliniella occidentalis]
MMNDRALPIPQPLPLNLLVPWAERRIEGDEETAAEDACVRAKGFQQPPVGVVRWHQPQQGPSTPPVTAAGAVQQRAPLRMVPQEGEPSRLYQVPQLLHAQARSNIQALQRPHSAPPRFLHASAANSGRTVKVIDPIITTKMRRK